MGHLSFQGSVVGGRQSDPVNVPTNAPANVPANVPANSSGVPAVVVPANVPLIVPANLRLVW